MGPIMGLTGVTTVGATGLALCSSDHVPAIDYGWSHHGLFAL